MAIIENTTFNRYKYMKLLEKVKSKQSFVLFGPRQTGKSTLLNQIFAQFPKEQKLNYDLQLPSHRQEMESDPESLIRKVESFSYHPVLLFIDEIQKCPAVMDVLQSLLDKKKIILMASGSSARKMRQLPTNWLPGRIHLEYLFPLTWGEAYVTEQPQKMNEHLLFGFLPEIAAHQDLEWRKEQLNSYTHLYLEEEIRREALVRKLPLFGKFLQLAALESGGSPNFHKLSNQIGVTHPTVREYFQILEDTLITHRLDFFGKSRNQVLRHPKYYFFDMGVRNAAAKIGHSDGILTLQMGKLFEHFIILECMAHFKQKAGLFYWSDGKREVDLIIEEGTKKTVIEIKATKKPVAEDFKGLDFFCKDHACQASFLVCQINVPEKFGDHLAIPWQQLLSRLGSSDI